MWKLNIVETKLDAIEAAVPVTDRQKDATDWYTLCMLMG